MGSRTDLAEREVAAQRARVASLLGELEERVQEDAHGLGDALSERTAEVQERVSDTVDELPGRRALEEQVVEHPLTALVGAVGVGVALGIASGQLMHGNGDGDYASDRSRRGPRQETRGAREREDDGGSKLMDALTGMAMSSLTGPVKHEIQTLARQALAGFLGEQSGEGYRRDNQRATAGGKVTSEKPAVEQAPR